MKASKQSRINGNDLVNRMLGETGHTQRWCCDKLDMKAPCFSNRLAKNTFYLQEFLDLAEAMGYEVKIRPKGQMTLF